MINEDTLASLVNELSLQSWENVLNTKHFNHAYNTFLNIFINMFNKSCPLRTVSRNCRTNKYRFTKGLKHAKLFSHSYILFSVGTIIKSTLPTITLCVPLANELRVLPLCINRV